jgi:hypothetical protein
MNAGVEIAEMQLRQDGCSRTFESFTNFEVLRLPTMPPSHTETTTLSKLTVAKPSQPRTSSLSQSNSNDSETAAVNVEIDAEASAELHTSAFALGFRATTFAAFRRANVAAPQRCIIIEGQILSLPYSLWMVNSDDGFNAPSNRRSSAFLRIHCRGRFDDNR